MAGAGYADELPVVTVGVQGELQHAELLHAHLAVVRSADELVERRAAGADREVADAARRTVVIVGLVVLYFMIPWVEYGVCWWRAPSYSVLILERTLEKVRGENVRLKNVTNKTATISAGSRECLISGRTLRDAIIREATQSYQYWNERYQSWATELFLLTFHMATLAFFLVE